MCVLDLFSGCGGFSLGFCWAGFSSGVAFDVWQPAVDTFNFNIGGCVCKDIKMVSDSWLEEYGASHRVLGVIGSPPCQGFSVAGKRNIGDKRNSLYMEFVRVVSIVKPLFFVLENVKGLLAMEDGFFKEDIIERFTRLGYNVNYEVLRASDYGVPQNRERVFFVGLNRDFFDDTFFEFPRGVGGNVITTSEALSDLPRLDMGDDPSCYCCKPVNEYQRFMRKNSSSVYNNDITHHKEKTKKIVSMIPDGGSIKDLPPEYYNVRKYDQAFNRMNSNKPSKTIDCGHRNYFHYNENRVPTVRECARLQSFPDDFIFTGSKTSQYTQVGNAVPPLVSYHIAMTLKKYLEI